MTKNLLVEFESKASEFRRRESADREAEKIKHAAIDEYVYMVFYMEEWSVTDLLTENGSYHAEGDPVIESVHEVEESLRRIIWNERRKVEDAKELMIEAVEALND